jgi:hypothetical protein
MTEGEITLEVPLADLVIEDGGLSELCFLEPGQEPVVIMTTSDRKPGLTCKKCSFFIVINDLEYTETECLVCRTSMPAGVTSCPKCGWSYKAGAD